MSHMNHNIFKPARQPQLNRGHILYRNVLIDIAILKTYSDNGYTTNPYRQSIANLLFKWRSDQNTSLNRLAPHKQNSNFIL
jgi:hypothetical protein